MVQFLCSDEAFIAVPCPWTPVLTCPKWKKRALPRVSSRQQWGLGLDFKLRRPHPIVNDFFMFFYLCRSWKRREFGFCADLTWKWEPRFPWKKKRITKPISICIYNKKNYTLFVWLVSLSLLWQAPALLVEILPLLPCIYLLQALRIAIDDHLFQNRVPLLICGWSVLSLSSFCWNYSESLEILKAWPLS